jgi:hypothetical protein
MNYITNFKNLYTVVYTTCAEAFKEHGLLKSLVVVFIFPFALMYSLVITFAMPILIGFMFSINFIY